MTKEKAIEASNLLSRLENIDKFLDELCNIVNKQEDYGLIEILNDTQVRILEYKKNLEDELEKL